MTREEKGIVNALSQLTTVKEAERYLVDLPLKESARRITMWDESEDDFLILYNVSTCMRGDEMELLIWNEPYSNHCDIPFDKSILGFLPINDCAEYTRVHRRIGEYAEIIKAICELK